MVDFKRTYLFFTLCVHLYACLSVCAMCMQNTAEDRIRALDPLGLRLEVVVSHLVGCWEWIHILYKPSNGLKHRTPPSPQRIAVLVHGQYLHWLKVELQNALFQNQEVTLWATYRNWSPCNLWCFNSLGWSFPLALASLHTWNVFLVCSGLLLASLLCLADFSSQLSLLSRSWSLSRSHRIVPGS